MTTTETLTNELAPLVISPLYSDCTIRVPLDDRSGFQDFKLHLCMLYESPYFEGMLPNPKKVRNVPTLKSHFEIILRYIYNKKEVVYNENNILDLITEGYRFSLPGFVEQLWSAFAQTASAKMVLEALKRIENHVEFSKRWGLSQLKVAAQRHILSLLDSLGELRNPGTIQFLIQVCATNQNPVLVLNKLLQWHTDKHYDFVRQMRSEFVTGYKWQTAVAKQLDGHLTQGVYASSFSADNMVLLQTYKEEVSIMVLLPCTLKAETKICSQHNNRALKIKSLSPLVVEYIPERWERQMKILRLWDKEGTFYISKKIKEGDCTCITYGIQNALEWAKDNELQFELILFESEVNIDAVKTTTNLPRLPTFTYPKSREKLSDFTVECEDEKGLVVYKLHKFILQKSPHFHKIFSLSTFIESKSNKVTLETPKHLFEVILRYLYNQEPLAGISSIITDVMSEASYFELNDFENDLWGLFEKEADVTNCIKAINLMQSNMVFELRRPTVMRVVARKIKAVLREISQVLHWDSVRMILCHESTKKQNPILVLESVVRWSQKHEPKNGNNRVIEIFGAVFGQMKFRPMIEKELKVKYPCLKEIKGEADPYNVIEKYCMTEGGKAVDIWTSSYGISLQISNTSELKLVSKMDLKQTELRIYDQLSHHHLVVPSGTNMKQALENIEEWKYGGYYRVAVGRFWSENGFDH